MDRRSRGERLGDVVAGFTGRLFFVVLHVLWFGGWILVNSGKIPGLRPLDPFPFALLNLIVSLEAIFLSTFVLMSQNRMSRQADHRTHLDLQINMLAEQETTRTLQMLQSLCQHLGLEKAAQDEELKQLLRQTEPDKLARGLKEHLPGE